MADASLLSVAVERAIHDALREAIQRISDQHHIQVTCVRIDWFDFSGYDSRTQEFRIREFRTEEFSR